MHSQYVYIIWRGEIITVIILWLLDSLMMSCYYNYSREIVRAFNEELLESVSWGTNKAIPCLPARSFSKYKQLKI